MRGNPRAPPINELGSKIVCSLHLPPYNFFTGLLGGGGLRGGLASGSGMCLPPRERVGQPGPGGRGGGGARQRPQLRHGRGAGEFRRRDDQRRSPQVVKGPQQALGPAADGGGGVGRNMDPRKTMPNKRHKIKTTAEKKRSIFLQNLENTEKNSKKKFARLQSPILPQQKLGQMLHAGRQMILGLAHSTGRNGQHSSWHYLI